MVESQSSVMDASGILAYLNRESGHEVIEKALADGPCAMSAVNFAEVLSKLVDLGMTTDEAIQIVATLNLHIVEFDMEMAEKVATLRTATRRIGALLGDRACLALAETGGSFVYTADRSWDKLNIAHVTIKVIR